jgi:hypothetical protein
MPKPTSKSRQELRSRFVRNAIPTEADFAELIAASLNQADDGVLKLPDQPLGLVRQKPEQPVLRFFADPAAEGSVWQVQLGSGDKPGFGLAAADGKLALFVDGATGNVGIGVGAKKPEAALHIAGNLKVEAGSIKLDSNQKVFFMDNGQIGGRDQYHQLLFRCTESITELREWGSIWLTAGNETCNNKPQIVVSQAEVKIGARLRISENNGTAANEVFGSLLLDHEDAGGASSIVFRSKKDQGSDYSFIEYKDQNPATQGVGASLLTIGNRNDSNDHIALMPSGNVGIDTTTPEFKLDVNGTVRLGGFTTEEKDEWHNIFWCLDLAKGWDEGLIKHGKRNGFFGRAGFGVHIHESRSFELFSTNARPLLGVEGGSGNTSIRGQTNILTGTNPIRLSSVWTAFPDDKTNGAEICNDTTGHKTLMIVGNKSNGGGRRVSIWDILEVGGSFQINNNGNTFKINTVGNKVEFFLAKSTHGDNRTISWDGDNNWDAPSDEKLKTNINIETGILPRLLQIDVKSFQWKDEPESKQKQLGFIAQDVRLAFPDLVKEKPFGDQSLLSLNYTNFGILAVGAIKELNAIMTAKIQELRIEIEDLKRQIGA